MSDTRRQENSQKNNDINEINSRQEISSGFSLSKSGNSSSKKNNQDCIDEIDDNSNMGIDLQYDDINVE